MGRYLVPALERGLAIINMFSRGRSTVTVPEIVAELGLPRASVFRLVTTLEACGYIERISQSHAFHLGPRALAAALEYLYSFDAADIARPILERVRDEIGATAQLAVRDGTNVIYIARAVAHEGKGSAPARLPRTMHTAHIVASGRALLFDLAPAALAALFAEFDFTRFPPPAPQTLGELAAILAADAELGYSIARDIQGTKVTGVAVPVRARDGKPIAAVTVFGQLLGDLALERRALDRVADAAAMISLGLGFRN